MTLLLLLACTPTKPSPSESGADTGFDTALDSAEDSGEHSAEDSAEDTDTGFEVSPTSVVVDPDCVDGAFEEEIPDTADDIRALVADFDSYAPVDFINAALLERYPLGIWLIEGGSEPLGEDCDSYFVDALDESLFETVPYLLLSTTIIVHECGHMFDLGGYDGVVATYYLNEELSLEATGIGSSGSPARSRIVGDTWGAARPPCPETGTSGCDGYADSYLNGDPDDDAFDSGDQGLDLLIEEWVQYNHSLATALAFSDEIAWSSHRDGVLTLLWYIERYLAYWRELDPAAYLDAMGDRGVATVILTIWGQSWDLLDASEGITEMGVEDAEILPLVEEPELLGEIAALRELVGCTP